MRATGSEINAQSSSVSDYEFIIEIPSDRVLKSTSHKSLIGLALILTGVLIIFLPVLSLLVLEFASYEECSWYAVCGVARFVVVWFPRMAASSSMVWLGIVCAYVAFACFGLVG